MLAGLSALGAGGLLVGLGLAYLERDDPSPVRALVVLVVATLVALAAAGLWVRSESEPRGLVLPAGARRLPLPLWWPWVGLVGLVDLAAGPAVSGWLGLAGLLLGLGALADAGRTMLRPAGNPSRPVVRAARRLRSVGRGPEPLVGALEPLGQSGTRVVAVGPTGRWLDVVLPDDEQASQAAELAGLDLRPQTDPAFSGAFTRGPEAWSRLLGPRRPR